MCHGNRVSGLQAEIISLAGKKIESCRAYHKCKENHRFAIDDGLIDIVDALRDAKGFIVA